MKIKFLSSKAVCLKALKNVLNSVQKAKSFKWLLFALPRLTKTKTFKT